MDFKSTQKLTKQFDKLKQILLNADTMACYQPLAETKVVYVSRYGLGATLNNHQENSDP